MAGVVSVSEQSNNSLGLCTLLKYEDDFTGELYDKMLYPINDYSPFEALKKFLDEVVGDDQIDVDGIILLGNFEDPALEFFVVSYKALYAVEFRNMHTAIHNLLVFSNEEDAYICDDALGEIEDGLRGYSELQEVLDDADTCIEIYHRDIEKIDNGKGGFIGYYDDDEHGILVVNWNQSYDLYL